MATEDVVRMVKAEIERLQSVLNILVTGTPAVIQPIVATPVEPVLIDESEPLLGSAISNQEPSQVDPRKGRKLSPEAYEKVVAARRKRAAEEKAASATAKTGIEGKPKRKMSPEGHASFMAVLRKRQAAKKKQAKVDTGTAAPKRKMSPEGLARLRASTAARWAKQRKAGVKGGRLKKIKA